MPDHSGSLLGATARQGRTHLGFTPRQHRTQHYSSSFQTSANRLSSSHHHTTPRCVSRRHASAVQTISRRQITTSQADPRRHSTSLQKHRTPVLVATSHHSDPISFLGVTSTHLSPHHRRALHSSASGLFDRERVATLAVSALTTVTVDPAILENLTEILLTDHQLAAGLR